MTWIVDINIFFATFSRLRTSHQYLVVFKTYWIGRWDYQYLCLVKNQFYQTLFYYKLISSKVLWQIFFVTTRVHFNFVISPLKNRNVCFLLVDDRLLFNSLFVYRFDFRSAIMFIFVQLISNICPQLVCDKYKRSVWNRTQDSFCRPYDFGRTDRLLLITL